MLFVAALLTHSVASAQTAPTDAPTGHNLYLSAALGFNSPSGFVGVEADFRINPLLTVGLGTGIGLWGHRISPMVKLDYATTRHSTVFLEGALSANLGSTGKMENNDTGATQEFIQDFLLSGSVSVGGRYVSNGPFFSAGRFGYSFPITRSSFRTADGSVPWEGTRNYLDFAVPSGFLVSIMSGMAF